jgi:TonB family protein
MDATDVLRDRMHEPDGLARMVMVSLGAHALLTAAIVLGPHAWLSPTQEAPKTVMTISLGGGGGPQNGGMTAMGGRPVQVETPPEELKRPQAVAPPAPKAPEMTLPKPGLKPTKASQSTVTQAPDQARGRTPTKGVEISAGSTVAVTGTRGQGFGLSTGGGPGAGSTLDITGDFCCPDYVVLMLERIRANWIQNQGTAGQVIVKFTIERSGQLTNVAVETSTGQTILELAAQRAVLVTKQLPPLPAQYPNPTLGVHLNFQYQQ